MNSVWNRLRLTFKADHSDTETDLSDEFQFHLDMLTEAHIARGMSPEEARLKARREFGGLEQAKEDYRELLVLDWLQDTLRDFRVAARSLAKRRGFTITAVLSLALGLGASTAIFSLVDRVLLRPLPFPNAARAINIQESRHNEEANSNPARLENWQSLKTLEHVAGYYEEGIILTAVDGKQVSAERVEALRTVGDWIALLGVQPLHGRLFTAEERKGIGSPVALLNERFWRKRFNGDPQVLNSQLTVNAKTFTVIGVLPASAEYPAGEDLVSPAPVYTQTTSRKAGFLTLVATMKPGVSLPQAQAEINVMCSTLASEYPASDAGLRARIEPAREEGVDQTRKPLLLLQAAVLAVLLIACVNIAGLLLARALSRRREIMIRLATGASVASIIRTHLTETLLISGLGGAAGLLVSIWGMQLLKTSLPSSVPHLSDLSLDWRVALFSFLLSTAVGIALGLLCAWDSLRADVWTSLKESGGAIVAGRSWMRQGMVVAQIALSSMLLVSAGLLLNSFLAMRNVPLGFDPKGLLTVSINLPWDTAKPKLDSVRTETAALLRSLPGVETVGVVDRLPLLGGSQTGNLEVQGLALPPVLETKQVGMRGMDGDYLNAMRIPLRAGRLLPSNIPEGAHYTVVNEALAHAYFPAGGALGKRISIDPKSYGWAEIIGIVGNTRATTSKPATPEFYLPLKDVYWPMFTFVVRPQGSPAGMANLMHRKLAEANPRMLIPPVETVENALGTAFKNPRLTASLLGGFSLAALFLASVGIYGVVMADVSRRTPEIGIRMALGATPPSMMRNVVGRGLQLALIGLPLGLLGATALGRFLRSLTNGTQDAHYSAFASAAVLILAVTLLSSYLPARRAARVDPIRALRHD